MDFGVRGIGGEIKLFPPPPYHGELDKWDDWSWQLKRYVGLCKPLAKLLMDEVETASNKVITDQLCEAFDVQQTQTQNNQLSLFARQLAYMLAQITDGAARAIVRNEDTENVQGFRLTLKPQKHARKLTSFALLEHPKGLRRMRLHLVQE